MRITGRVQGVGYRAWVEREARLRGLNGWVRNRQTGEVEAVFCGPEEVVGDMIEACRHGPDWARVEEIEILSDAAPVVGGFSVERTV